MEKRPRQYVLYTPVDSAALALGYTQTVLASLACFYVVMNLYQIPEPLPNRDLSQRYAMEMIGMSMILMGSVIALGYLITVAVLLVIGVKKRVAGYVLTFLVTGSLEACMVITVWVMGMFYGLNWLVALGIFCGFVVYLVWLFMVYCVYDNIKLEKNPNSLAYNTLRHPKEIEAQKDTKIVM